MDAMQRGPPVKDILKRVRGCFRNSEQTWITEPKCELKPSKKHGFGIFATVDIEPFELITLYPADGVRVWLADGCVLATSKGFQGMTVSTCVDYSAEVPEYGDWRVEIVGDPCQTSDPFYLGHMANDYCKMNRVEQTDIYVKTSLATMNAGISNEPFGLYSRYGDRVWEATGIRSWKPIKAGEEIYIHYGENYWLKKAEWEAAVWEAEVSSAIVELSAMD